MANELLVSTVSGTDVYAVGRVANGNNIGEWGIVGGALEVFAAANWATYAIVMAELGTTGLFQADMPDVFNGERAVDIIFLTRAGAAPVQGDVKISGALYFLADDWMPTEALVV